MHCFVWFFSRSKWKSLEDDTLIALFFGVLSIFIAKNKSNGVVNEDASETIFSCFLEMYPYLFPVLNIEYFWLYISIVENSYID